MTESLKRVKVAPKGMGLNDFVAMQEGFFAAEGLDVEFDWKTFRGTQSSWKGLEYFQRPQDRPIPRTRRRSCRARACGARICNASAGMGRVVTEGYGMSPWAIFVRPDSKIHKPEDLKDVPISVGMRAGSHFNVPYRLEKYLPLENIKTVNTGGFGARLKALLDGEVEAASLLPPQIAMAEQLGMRKIIEDAFKTLWWVPNEFAAGSRARLHARAQSRRTGARGRPAEISAAMEARRAGRNSRTSIRGTSASSAAASDSSTSRCRKRNSTRSSAGRALGPRSIRQGPQPRDADLRAVTRWRASSSCTAPGRAAGAITRWRRSAATAAPRRARCPTRRR